MKRHEALIPLTHDHHQGLAHARRLKAAADGDDTARNERATEFIRFFEEDTLLHFHEEEEEVFPHLLRHSDEPPAVLTEVLVEHVRIHGLVAQLRGETQGTGATTETMQAVASALESHIRKEEKQLFPLIEQTVPGAELGDIHLAERDRRPVE